MTGWQFLGAAIIAAMFGAAFMAVAHIEGWKVASLIWSSAFLFAGMLFIAAALITGAYP